MAQKSLLEKFADLFHKQHKLGGSRLSAAKAIDLQKAYAMADCIADSPISATYPEIIKQLYSAKTEVVTAALYYLQKIALNESAQTAKILEDLESLLSARVKIAAKHKEKIAQTVAAINKLRKI